MLVTQHLDLNVAWIVNELLNQHAIVAEARRSFRLRQIETFPTDIMLSDHLTSTLQYKCSTAIVRRQPSLQQDTI